MTNLSPRLENFLKTHVDDINESRFGKLYEDACFGSNKLYDMREIGDMTRILIDAGLSPLDNLNYIPTGFFAGWCFEEFRIPNGIELICMGAFHNCKYLKSIYMPNSVKKIEPMAFKNCEQLKTVNLSNDLVSMEDFVFKGCSNLHILHLQHVNYIGRGVFDECPNLTVLSYDGTFEQFKNVCKAHDLGFELEHETNVKQVFCGKEPANNQYISVSELRN